MEPTFPFESFIVFAGLGIFLLVGMLFRSKIGFFQRYLIPSCLIGGFIAMILRNLGLLPMMSSDLLQTLIYHLFNVSFISVGLTPPVKNMKKGVKGIEKIRGPLGMGLMQGVVFPMQAVLGGLMTIVFVFFGFNLFSTFGFLTSLGFTEGPGQALSLGQSWEQIAGGAYIHSTTVGLAFAAIGFFFAFFIGVSLVNWAIRKGLASEAKKELPLDFLKGFKSRADEKPVGGRETTHPANVDVLSFHAGLVGLIFVLTFGLVRILTGYLPPDLAKTFWGFFFFFGLVIAFFIRWFMNKLGFGYIIDRNIQKRITGWSVDFLLVATITAIELAIVWKFLLPILSISITAGVVTLFVVVYIGKHIWDRFAIERVAGIFGTVTGTLPSGLLLVRILDPEFRTSAAVDLGLTSIFAAPFILSGMILVNAPVLWGWNLLDTLLVFAAMSLISFVLFFVFRLWGKPSF
ncbi:MAG: hypothetical protein V5A68_03110 [Candidatus Thermoplasmatota archaeon]